jgi:hypothetical protein
MKFVKSKSTLTAMKITQELIMKIELQVDDTGRK